LKSLELQLKEKDTDFCIDVLTEVQGCVATSPFMEAMGNNNWMTRTSHRVPDARRNKMEQGAME